MKILKILASIFLTIILVVGLTAFLYLKVLPWAVANKKVMNFIENSVSEILGAEFSLQQPHLKTEWRSGLYLKFKNASIKDGDKVLLNVDNFDSIMSLKKIFKKELIIKKIYIDSVNADVSAILSLPPFKDTKEKQGGLVLDIFESDMNIKKANIFYQIDKENSVKADIKNLTIADNPDKKYMTYDMHAILMRDGHTLNIWTKEDGRNTTIENKQKLVLKNSNLKVDKTNILLNGDVDSRNYNLNFKGEKFKLNHAIDILNSQIIANNFGDYLAYFKNTDGDFNFDVDVKTSGIKGKVWLNKISFMLVPMANIPIVLNQGEIIFDSNKINLKNFKGYYDGKLYNGIDFAGVVNDYTNTVDTDITGNAIVTNDFAKKYFSKMVSYPLEIKGKADTRIMLKSKNNKMDAIWLYKFEKGNGFIIDGEEPFLNDRAIRVLVAKMHLENNLLALKSLDYHIARQDEKRNRNHIPILSMNGNIDLSGGKQAVQDFGLTLTKPMPSGFVNMLIKQNLFKNGTFTGYMRYINKGKNPVLNGDFQVNEVGIPSQRLFVKSGSVKTENGNLHIVANGGYRRSKYNVDAKIKNEIVFPIIVKDANLEVDNMDVEKYLQPFNNQTVSDKASENVHDAISKSLEKDVESDENIQTFDLANLIVEKCTLKVKKGNYKKIDFADIVGHLTLDKNSILNLNSNRFNIAEGQAEAKINCDLKKHKYNLILALIRVNSDTMATELVNLPKEINGKASGILDLNTDESLKLNGTVKFVVQNGEIAKIGLVEYTMKVASLFRNPIVMVTPSVVADLVDVPEGKFDRINGSLTLERNVIRKMVIKTVSPMLSTYIVGRYNLDNQDAILRVYTRFSNRKKGAYGFLRSVSLNTLANRIPLSTRNNSNYYEAEIKELPPIEADEKDCQIFLTKVDGDIVSNNFLSSLHRIK